MCLTNIKYNNLIKRLPLLVLLSFMVSCGGSDDSHHPAASPSLAISSPAVTTTTDNATIVWTSTIETTHIVEYGEVSGNYTLSTVQSATPMTSHIVELDGLLENQTYYYRVKNFSDSYPTVTSGEFSFTTATGIQVINLSSTTTTATATISWDTNVGTLHQLEYGTTAGNYVYALPFSTVASTSHSVNLSGLDPNTTYYYRATSVYPDFSDVVSRESSFTTASETPPTLIQKMRSIWIVGGLSGNTISTPILQVDIYDPLTNTWYPAITSLPTPVSFAAVASVQGKIYVIGGYGINGNVSATNQEYDVVTDTWTYRSAVNFQPRSNVTAAVVGTKIFVLGGTTAAYNAVFSASTNTQCFNTATGDWALGLTAFGAATADRISISYGEVVSNFGGRTTGLAAGLTTTHDGYSVIANSLTTGVTEVTLTGTARTGMAQALYDSGNGTVRMLTAGGVSTFAGTATCHLFNGITAYTSTAQFRYLEQPFAAPAVWQAGPDLPASLSYGAGVVNNGNFFVFGGTSVFPPFARDTVYEINAESMGVWSSRPTMPVGRYGHSAVSIDQ